MGLSVFLPLFMLTLSVLTLAGSNFVATIKEARDSIKPELRRLVMTHNINKFVERAKIPSF